MVKPTMFCLALVFFLARLTETEAKRVYPLNVKLETYFTCESVPKNNLSCPGDIKVIKGSGAITKMSMNLIYANLRSVKAFANQTCIEAIKKSTCLGFARCERERQYVDIDVAIAACEDARKVCPKIVSDPMLNCTDKKMLYEATLYNATKYHCKNIQDSNGTCPDIKYKVADLPGFKMQDEFNAVKQGLQNLKPNITSECFKTVQITSCLLVGVICSADEKNGVSYISKQECTKRFECIPEKYRGKGMCDHLPDESKGIDESDPNGVSFQTGSHVITAILLFSGVLFW